MDVWKKKEEKKKEMDEDGGEKQLGEKNWKRNRNEQEKRSRANLWNMVIRQIKVAQADEARKGRR
jgi:hypothetical protein